MNFSLELSGAMMTGSIDPDALMGMGTVFGALFGGIAIIFGIIYVVIMVLMLISRWKVFEKAGLPGWGIFIPVYNMILMFKLGGFSGRRILSVLFPPLFFVMVIINIFNIAKKFGRHWTFGLGILFIGIVFIPILAFGDSKYLGKKTVVKVAAKAPSMAGKPVKKVVKKIIKKNNSTTKKPAKKVVKKVKTLTKRK